MQQKGTQKHLEFFPKVYSRCQNIDDRYCSLFKKILDETLTVIHAAVLNQWNVPLEWNSGMTFFNSLREWRGWEEAKHVAHACI